MKRRQFIGAISGSALVGLSGCLTSRFPTGFLHALLPKERNSEKLRQEIQSAGIPNKNIYMNEFLNAMQVRGDYETLESLSSQLDLRDHKLYSSKKYIPFLDTSQETQQNDSSEGLVEFSLLGQLVADTQASSNSSIGMIDTSANWSSWYENESFRHRKVAQNMNPILGPLLRDKDHGSYTAKTLFHPTQNVNSDGPHIQGLASKSTPYHAEISAIVTLSQFFRSLCESLEWMAKENVDITVLPLSTVSESQTIMTQILEEYVSDLSESIIVVSAGNVNVCDGEINSLANSDLDEIVGVGAIEEGDLVSGQSSISDILGPSDFIVDSEGNKYSGTSASSTVIAGVLGIYMSTLKKEYPELTQSECISCALTGLLDTGEDVSVSCSSSTEVLSRVRPVQGLDQARRKAESFK